MIIHVVQQGDTISSISKTYEVSEERLIQENGITNPDQLVVGQTIVIVYPMLTYTIQEGDTLQGIADTFNVDMMQLLRNNPYLSDRKFIYPGETIVISYGEDKIGKMSTDGHTYSNINRNILRKTLPFLTYLTIHGYTYNENGKLNDINDMEIIRIAKEYRVAPIMKLVGLSESLEEEVGLINIFLFDTQRQDQLISNVIGVLENKGYYGVNINTPYISPQNENLYLAFLNKFTSHLNREGYMVFVTLILTLFDLITNTYEYSRYEKLGQVVNKIMITAYDWGNPISFPVLSHPFDLIRYTVEQATKFIPADKVWIGITVIEHIWELPYKPGVSRGLPLNYQTVLELAVQFEQEIKFNEVTKLSYFHYLSNVEYVVQFRDARGLNSYVNMVHEVGNGGLGLWNIMSFFAQLWLLINAQYEIEKVI